MEYLQGNHDAESLFHVCYCCLWSYEPRCASSAPRCWALFRAPSSFAWIWRALLSCSTRDAASTSSRTICIRSCEQASRCFALTTKHLQLYLRWVLLQRRYLCLSSFVIETHPTRSRVLVWRDSLVAPSWTKLALRTDFPFPRQLSGRSSASCTQQ